MLCIYLIVYRFVHNVILNILAHFYIFRLFFFQITENYLLICFISAIYMFKITIVELFILGFFFSVIMVNRQYVLDFSVIVISKLSLCF